MLKYRPIDGTKRKTSSNYVAQNVFKIYFVLIKPSTIALETWFTLQTETVGKLINELGKSVDSTCSTRVSYNEPINFIKKSQ